MFIAPSFPNVYAEYVYVYVYLAWTFENVTENLAAFLILWLDKNEHFEFYYLRIYISFFFSWFLSAIFFKLGFHFKWACPSIEW